MKNKTELDYLNYTDLNYIENKIETVTNQIKQDYIPEIPTFNKKTWVLNELPYVQEISRIEDGIKNIGYYFYEPKGWQTKK